LVVAWECQSAGL